MTKNKLKMIKPLLIRYKKDFDEKLELYSTNKWSDKTKDMMNSVLLRKSAKEVDVSKDIIEK